MSEENVKSTHKRNHKWAFPVGLIIVLLAVVGLVFLIVTGAKSLGGLFDNSKEIAKYNTLLTPVVMNNPDPFDDISKANKSQLADIAIWSILTNDLTPDKYQYSDSGMIIPAADVEAKFHELFGSDTAIQFITIEGYGYTFTYDSAANTYVIPLTGIVPTYTPDVVDISKKGSSTILTVGCLAGNQWAQAANGDMVAPEPDKYIKVTLRTAKDGSTYISAIQDTDAPEKVSTTETTKVTTTAAPTTTAPAAEQTSEIPTEQTAEAA